MDEVVDERGQWTMLAPSSTEDTSATFCLAPGEYEIVGSEGAYCAEGWSGGYVRVVDTIGNALLAYFTMVPNDGCSAMAVFAVEEDPSVTSVESLALFESNRATGTSKSEFCGLGCGGALYIRNYGTTAQLDRVAFSLNTAADGGALYVDLLGDLTLATSVLHDNVALSGNGGAMHIGMAATIDAKSVVAKRNKALTGSGDMLYLSNVNAATLRDCDTIRNDEAGTNSGGIAVFDCSRSTTTITNSVVGHNQAGESGGGVFALNSKVDVIGVQITDNSADLKNGGGLATSGTESLELRDVPCVDMEVLLDWNAAGSGYPVLFDDSSGDVIDSYNCDTGLYKNIYGASSCHNLEAFHSHHSVDDDAYTRSGCTCNNKWGFGCCALAL